MELVTGEAGLQGIRVEEDAEVLELYRGTFPLVLGKRDVQELTEGCDGGEVLGALVGVGGARNEKVIEVVVYVGDSPFPSKPLHCLCKAVEYKGG